MEIQLDRLEAALPRQEQGQFVDVQVDDITIQRLCPINGRFWFEYHCYEGHDPPDERVLVGS